MHPQEAVPKELVALWNLEVAQLTTKEGFRPAGPIIAFIILLLSLPTYQYIAESGGMRPVMATCERPYFKLIACSQLILLGVTLIMASASALVSISQSTS
ncbi:hypothetical protein GGR55DRAFT_652671 [Xylaria sp. FL0064]|nr:hypothetical protein GGR55DRAFT_652671 [Xylaria sp. FL0064]